MREALELVRTRSDYGEAPARISCPGGQQQRVALARALVTAPRLCCCSTSRSGRSTPKIRKALQIELKAIQREVGITFIYVTHDQEEALTHVATGSRS